MLEFARPESVLYTNIGQGKAIDAMLAQAGYDRLLAASELIEHYHGRGADELVIRATKEFASEKLPCKRFNMNAVYYYTMLVSFFVFQAFKEDVSQVVVSAGAYATTLRRRLIDFAAKIVRHAGRVVLKVTQAAYEQLRLDELWARSGDPPPFAWAA